MPLADAANELLVLDTLRPLLERIAKLNLRSLDAQFVAGSEVFAVALEGYKQMRRHGDDEGLRLACKEMGTLFAKSSAKAKAARARATAEPDVPAVHPPA